jgi:2'-5' RNA ligase
MRWIYLEVDDESVDSIISEAWFDELEDEGFEIEKDPHITLIPGYQSKSVPELLNISDSQSIEVSGIRCWPSHEKPMVVMLDVSDSMLVDVWRDEMLSRIGEGAVEYDIVPAHITLFKAGDAGDEDEFCITPEVRDTLVDKIGELEGPKEVDVVDIVRTSWDE